MLATAAVVALFSSEMYADVTIKVGMAVEGAAAASLPPQMPTVTTRIKGMKARTDVDVGGQMFSAIMDAEARQLTVLQTATKTAVILATPDASEAPALGQAAVSVDLKPTGHKRQFGTMSCDEQSITMSFEMTDPSGPAVPPEAAAFMKGARIRATGSIWYDPSAPGAAEFVAFQKAAVDARLSPLAALAPGPSGGMDKIWAALQSVAGVPCYSEMQMTFEGTGPMVELLKQQGPVKVIQTTEAVSTDALPDDIFAIPAEYKVEKK